MSEIRPGSGGSGDIPRNPLFHEGSPSSPRFIVRAEGSGIVTDWLKLQRRVLDNPMLAPDTSNKTSLNLGTIGINDQFIGNLGSNITVDPDAGYELQTAFTLTEGNPLTALSGRNPVQLFLSQLDRPSTTDAPIPLTALARTLQADPLLSVTYDRREDRLSLTRRTEVGDIAEGEATFTFHRIDHPLVNAYCLHAREEELSDESIERLPQNHERLAGLTQQIVHALYDVRREPEPEETFVIVPPKNTQRTIKQQSDMLDARSRMLSATGMVDDSDDLAREVERNIVLERRPNITFDDIGGNESAKETLETVVDALRNPDSYRQWGTQPPRGVMLFGPPGTGKTLLAKALAHEAEADIYVVNTADVLHSLYGKTEKLIQAIFDRARQNGPAVLLFDELDALAAQRDRSTEVTSRIVSVLLQNLDGLEERDNNIIVVGTTNRLDAIDPALLRPKRFGDVLAQVELPNDNARGQIFDIHMRRATERAEREIFIPDLDLNQLISHTSTFSGADIEEIIRRTLAKKARLQAQGQQPSPVTTDELLDAINKYERIKQAKDTAQTGQYL